MILYDVIIYGHYHFYKYHKMKNIEFYFLNGTGVVINNKSIYYVLMESLIFLKRMLIMILRDYVKS